MTREARENARAMLERGVRVIRVQPGRKEPLDMLTQPISDLEMFNRVWTSDTCNSGLVMGAADGMALVAIDIDVKPDQGVNGLKSLEDAGIDIFSYGTWWQKTPGGGYHFIFQTDGELLSNRQGRSGLPGVDVRGHHGMIVGPGSVNGTGGAYVPFDMEYPFEPLPPRLRDFCMERKEKDPNAREFLVEAGGIEIEMARQYLRHEAPQAIAGRRGSDTTYDVACEIRDLGLDFDAALAAMAEHYNPFKCAPPWSAEELRRIVRNAYEYAQNPAGCKSPQRDFEPMPSLFPHTQIDPAESVYFEPRRWAVKDFLERGVVTTLAAPGGSGKSLFCIALSVCMAYGNAEPLKLAIPDQPASRDEPGPRRSRVALFNNEDTNETIKRRIHAACRRYDWPHEEVEPRIFLRYKPPRKPEQRVVLFGLDVKKNSVTRRSEYWMLREWLKQERIDLLILDPLSSIMEGPDENSNTHMPQVMGALTDLATDTGCAVFVVSHSRKGGVAGDAEAQRGASAIRDGARAACSLYTMTEGEAEAHNVPIQHRWQYARLDGTKANYHALDATPKWYRKRTERVPENSNDPDHEPGSSDTEGVIEWEDLSSVVAERREKLAQVLAEVWPDGKETWSFEAAAAAVTDHGGPFDVSSAADLRSLLNDPLDLGDGRRVRKNDKRRLRLVDTSGKSD